MRIKSLPKNANMSTKLARPAPQQFHKINLIGVQISKRGLKPSAFPAIRPIQTSLRATVLSTQCRDNSIWRILSCISKLNSSWTSKCSRLNRRSTWIALARLFCISAWIKMSSRCNPVHIVASWGRPYCRYNIFVKGPWANSNHFFSPSYCWVIRLTLCIYVHYILKYLYPCNNKTATNLKEDKLELWYHWWSNFFFLQISKIYNFLVYRNW